MVEGVDALRRRFRGIAREVEKQLKPELEKQATKIAAQMSSVKPLPDIQIEWKWGPPPAGVISLGTVSNAPGDREFISIYATATTSDGSFPAVARWFEFGTLNRFHKSGKFVGAITAQPYFFPVYRANRKAVVSAIRRKVTQTVKNL